MIREPLPAHSLAEAQLYLLAHPCRSCGKGPVRGEQTTAKDQGSNCETVTVEIQGICATCGTQDVVVFRVSGGIPKSSGVQPSVVNPTDEPSQILDLVEWVTLFRMITEAASREANRTRARELGIEAAQCLEESLRFFEDEDVDFPPARAFFSDKSRLLFQEHPERFSRKRLLELRSKLPSLAVMRTTLERPKRRSWWGRSK